MTDDILQRSAADDTNHDQRPAPFVGDSAERLHPRFDIEVLEVDKLVARTTMAMPLASKRSPLTGAIALGSLAILIDSVGGLTNHLRRAEDEWGVSSELTVDVCSGFVRAVEERPDIPVVAHAWPVGPKEHSAFAACSLMLGGVVVGTGSVRSYYLPAAGVQREAQYYPLAKTPSTSFAEMLGVRLDRTAGSTPIISQLADPGIKNALGIVNGGVAAAGAELAASAAIHGANGPAHTASFRVNFLRPFHAGGGAHYVGSVLRAGRNIALAEGNAINGDGSKAATVVVTAYR
ncbi:hotdog domain-containing protein [Mycobacterium malmoense]|uniref:hotdog domain-containing protein n=1 Tax=Mycobacterium malmoense TaxID=1780 RepID=UPI0009F4A176|nr:hotdog domain-containing protein [Mycobacterium malmoense]